MHKNKKNRKKFLTAAAMVMSAVFVFQTAAVADSQGMGNLLFEVTKDSSDGNQTVEKDNLYEYFFDDIDSFNFKKLSKKKGGSFLNSKAPAKYAKYYTNPYYPGSGRWLNSKYGKKYLRKISDARKNNKYTTLIKYDMRLGEWAYICKYGTKTKLHTSKYSITDPYFGNGTLFHEAGLDDRYPDFNDGNSCLTIPELRQLKKKGYLKKSLYYGTEQPKNITINVGETVTNKPSNIPDKNWINKKTGYGINQSWNVYTPENIDKAKKNNSFSLKWKIVGNDSLGSIIGKKINIYQNQNGGYDFSNIRSGSDVAKVDTDTGKIIGLKKGTAYVVVSYNEYYSSNPIQDKILQASKIEDSAAREKAYNNIRNSEEYFKMETIFKEQYEEMMKTGQDSCTRVKFYRIFKVTVQ